MTSYLPQHAIDLRDLYARIEHVLRRNGYLLPNRKKAQIDWKRFADELGNSFFQYVSSSNGASTLLQEPPRAYLSQGGWGPQIQTPITNVEELFTRGVCQVRHNIEHGEKFILPEGARGDALVHEAVWILREAVQRHPKAKIMFSALV